ncbi:nonstructural protein [Apis mellifera associated microvirus 33]|nr:nonstructural protein [Apis mellifera associated microvirus 33]
MFGKKDNKTPDLEMFAIYDSKVGAYQKPTFAPNRHALTRDVINMFKDPAQAQNQYLLNAEDYIIFKIGEFYFKTGELIGHPPESVVNMHELRTVAKQDLGIVAT